MAQVRRIAGLLVLLSVLAVAVVWLGAGFWAMSSGPNWLSWELKSRGIAQVTIGSIRTNFLNSITLRDVAFVSPVPGSIDEAKFSFRPWDLFSLRSRDRNIFWVTLQRPSFVLPAKLPSSGSTSKGPLKIIPFGATLVDGTFEGESQGIPWRLEQVNGVVGVTPFRVNAEITGAWPEIGHLRAQLRAACRAPRNWELRVETSGVDVPRVVRIFPRAPESLSSLSGKAGGEVTVKGDWAKRLHVLDWRIRARTSALTWRRPGAAKPVPLKGEIEATRRSIRLMPLRVGAGLSIEGDVLSPLKNPTLNLRAKASGQPVEDLIAYAGGENGAFTGDLSGDFSIRGPAAAPAIQGTYQFAGATGNLRLPPASGSISFSDRQLQSTTSFAGGEVLVSAVDVARPSAVWSVNARRISLASFAEENGWPSLAGTVGARFFARGPDLSVNGRVDVSPVRWGRLRFAGAKAASISLTRDELIIRADDGSVAVTAFRDGSKISLQNLQLAMTGAGSVSATGEMDLKSRALDLDAEFSDVAADVWPPLVTRYPGISGSLSAKGKLGGFVHAPTADFDLSWSNLRFRADGDPYQGNGKLQLSDQEVAIQGAKWAEGYAGDASWNRLERSWKANLRLEEASPTFIRDVIRSTQIVSGLVSGQIQAQGGRAVVVTSSFTWLSGQLDAFTFDQLAGEMDWRGDHIALRSASLVKGAQAIRGQADLTKAGAAWKFESLAQVQQWGLPPMTVDGEIRVAGDFDPAKKSLRAHADAPVFWLADRSLENFSAEIRGDGNRLTIDGKADDRASFQVSADRLTGKLRGNLRARDLELTEIFPPAGPDAGSARLAPPTGLYDIEATLSGTINDPAARIRAKINDGVWRLEPFSAQAMLDVNRSTLNVVSARVSIKAGGEIFASGVVALRKGGPVKIEGAGEQVDLQALFHALWWPVKWDGKTDIAFVIERNDGPFTSDIRFEGEHEGFGPFREGGELRGEIVGRDREWTLGGVFVESGDGHALLREGSKIYLDKSGAATLRLVSDLRNLRMGPLTLFGGMEAVGRWQGQPGENNTRHIDIDVFARSLWINQFVFDGNVTRLEIHDKNISFAPIPGSGQQLSGSLSYDAYPDLFVKDFRFMENGKERVWLDGNVGTRFWDFRLRTRGVDAGVVRGLLDTSLRMSGPMDLDIVGKGSPSHPDITADVKWTDGRVGVFPLDEATGKFSYHEGEVRLDNVLISKKRGYVARGSAHLGVGDARETVPFEVDAQVERGDLTMLQDMFTDVSEARGTFEGRLRIGGSETKASISGYFNAQKILLRSAYTPSLDKGELKIRFDNERLNVDRATARLGHGDVVGGGSVDFEDGRPARYDLFLKTTGDHGASIRVPQLAIAPGPVLGRFSILKKKLAGVSRGEPVFDLEFSGPAGSPTLSGRITLDNTVFTYPPSQKGGDESGWWKNVLATMNWDLSLTAGKRAWYQNELVDAGVSGNIDVRGPRSDLDVNGKIYSDQGSIVYSGNEFRIKEAELEVETRRPILLSDSKQTIVYLKATAEKEVFYTDGLNNSNHDVIVMVVDRAPIGEIQPRFYSKNNPSLSSQRALQLALGLPFGDAIETNSLLPDQRTRVSDQADTDKLLRLGLVQLLDSSLASPLARAIARNTGLVDFIRVSYQENDPNAQEGIPEFEDRSGATDVTQNQFLKYAKGTKVRFGRGLGRRLFADYSFRVDEYENELNLRHEVELAYRLHRNLFLRGTSELDHEAELGRPPDRRAILENQWRFGLPRQRVLPAPSPSGSSLENRPKAG